MLDLIIRFSIRNKLVVGILMIALIAWGGYSLTKLPIDAVPDITNNQVQIITVAPSQSAQDIERLVTFPLEQSVSTIPEITEGAFVFALWFKCGNYCVQGRNRY